MSSKSQNEKRKILTVDDDSESLKIIRKALQWEGYQIEVATSGLEAIEKIAHWHPNLVLLDVNMPDLDGLETLKLLRQSPDYVATIFVSGKSDTEDIVRGLDAGADDYICKPFNPVELLARIRCHLRIKDIRDELNSANAKLKELVDIDDLTGLYNMRSLYQKLDFELNRAARYDRAVSAIMMDMDHFKAVNDEHDHLFGSFVLSQVGQIIRENIRKVDFAARYGGDEFLVILTETSPDGTSVFCDRLRSLVEARTFKNDQHERKMTVSIGYAYVGPEQKGLDAKTLVRYADRALYQAKESGRNCVVKFDFEKDLPGQSLAPNIKKAAHVRAIRRKSG